MLKATISVTYTSVLRKLLWLDILSSFFICQHPHTHIDDLRPKMHGRHFADDKFIFWNENVLISIRIPLKFVAKGPNYDNPVLVQIMAWRQPGAKTLLNHWWLDYRRIYVGNTDESLVPNIKIGLRDIVGYKVIFCVSQMASEWGGNVGYQFEIM